MNGSVATRRPLPAEKLVGWLDEISRRRTLTDEETDMLEAIICYDALPVMTTLNPEKT